MISYPLKDVLFQNYTAGKGPGDLTLQVSSSEYIAPHRGFFPLNHQSHWPREGPLFHTCFRDPEQCPESQGPRAGWSPLIQTLAIIPLHLETPWPHLLIFMSQLIVKGQLWLGSHM